MDGLIESGVLLLSSYEQRFGRVQVERRRDDVVVGGTRGVGGYGKRAEERTSRERQALPL